MPRGRRPRWYLRHERSRLLSSRQIRFRKNYDLRVARHILGQIRLRLLGRLSLLGHSTPCSHSPRGNGNRQDSSFYGLSSVHFISSPVGSGFLCSHKAARNSTFASRNSPQFTPLVPVAR